jgi:tetratricopeptide (TPR) repeat protein
MPVSKQSRSKKKGRSGQSKAKNSAAAAAAAANDNDDAVIAEFAATDTSLQPAAAGAASNKSKGKGKAKASKKQTPAHDNATTEDLIEQARHAQDSLQPDLAVQFYQRALQTAPDNTDLLDEAADLMLQLGMVEEARAALAHSIELSPDSNASRWLYMAQLHEGEEALQLYIKALELLLRDISAAQELDAERLHDETLHAEQLQWLRGQYCTGCCAVAELYMTDLCFADDAETQAQTALTNALQHADQSVPEPHQAMANLRLSQDRPAEAVPYIKEAAKRLQTAVENNDRLPDYGFRVSTAKVLLECSEVDTSCCDDALAVLSGKRWSIASRFLHICTVRQHCVRYVLLFGDSVLTLVERLPYI